MALAEQETTQVGELDVARAKYLVDELQKAINGAGELEGQTKAVKEYAMRQISEYALSVKMAKVNPEHLEAFFKRPYPQLRQMRGRPDVWELALPRFMDVNIGWLERQDDAWNYFTISRQGNWLGEIPEELRKQLGWQTPPDLIIEGEELVGKKKDLDEARKKYAEMLVTDAEGRVKVNPRRSFDLLVALLRDGVRPFARRPVNPSDLVNRPLAFQLRDYQKAAWAEVMEYSNATFLWPPSVGKTIIALYGQTHLKGPHLVAVRTNIVKEQWRDRIEAHTDLKLDEEIFVLTYQAAITKSADLLKKLGASEWGTKTIDEVQHFPSDYVSKMAFIPSRHTFGLTATPYREDGRDEYIMALTGPPVGLPWEEFKRMGVIRTPDCHVWVVRDEAAKMRQLEAIVRPDVKTIIFSDFLDPGREIAKKFGIKFYSGETKDNLRGIKESLASPGLVVVSRVGDEGMSLPDLGCVIEFTWNQGSRMQSMQRFGRLLHSQMKEVAHNIIMTLPEFVHDRKRLYSIMEKGFKIRLHREGIPDKVIESIERGETAPRPRMSEPRRWKREPASRPSASPDKIDAYVVPQVPQPLIQRLPGITGRLEALPRVERLVATTFLANPDKAYSTRELSLATNLALETVKHQAHLGKLVSLGYIKQELNDEGKSTGKFRSAL